MKTVLVSDIKTQVRKILDEQGLNDALFLDSDNSTIELDSCIESKILEAVNLVHLKANYFYIDGESLVGSGTLTINSDLSGLYTFTAGKYFLRLVSLKVSSWKFPVIQEIRQNDPSYRMQKDEFVRGSYENPVVAYYKSGTTEYLELFSCKTASDTITMLNYIPNQTTLSTSVLICDKLEKSVYYMIAGFVSATYKDSSAETLLKIANTLMGN